MQGVKSVLQYHDNHFIYALVQLFPEIGLDRDKFEVIPCIKHTQR